MVCSSSRVGSVSNFFVSTIRLHPGNIWNRTGEFYSNAIGEFCSVETHMNGSSHPKHENHYNIYHNILRANPPPSGVARPPRRGLTGQVGLKGKGLNRRGGAPPGAAAFIVFEGMGVSTHIINHLKGSFSWEILFSPIIHSYSLPIVRMTPSLPRRGRQPKGNIPLTPLFILPFSSRFFFKPSVVLSRYGGCPRGGGGGFKAPELKEEPSRFLSISTEQEISTRH